MSAVTQLRKPVATKRRIDVIVIKPEDALKLLERNTLNRPLSQPHVARIADQIKTGNWKFNGDTIKIADGGDIVDGQHRLWAIIESKQPVETVVVYGVPRDAFATVDTLRKPRNGADILALNGVTEYRSATSLALTFLVRWQRKCWHGPNARVENSDIEGAYSENPAMLNAAERATKAIRGLASPGLFAFLYYIIANRSIEIADRLIDTLADPSGVSVNDPFFRLRSYLSTNSKGRRDPVMVMALTIKAANLVAKGEKCKVLNWRNQGENAESFPSLNLK